MLSTCITGSDAVSNNRGRNFCQSVRSVLTQHYVKTVKYYSFSNSFSQQDLSRTLGKPPIVQIFTITARTSSSNIFKINATSRLCRTYCEYTWLVYKLAHSKVGEWHVKSPATQLFPECFYKQLMERVHRVHWASLQATSHLFHKYLYLSL